MNSSRGRSALEPMSSTSTSARNASSGPHRRLSLGQLHIRVFQRLLKPLGVASDLAHPLLPGTGQIAQCLYRRRWDEAAPDQAHREQVREPGGVLDVALAARNVADMPRIRPRE